MDPAPDDPARDFVFYCSAHPRHLHSFPTRRSSDLLGGVAFAEPPETRGLGKSALAGTTFTFFPDESSAMKRPDTEAIAFVAFFGESVRGLSAGVSDRKSTRLNSSHVKISYAVFCLK